MVEPQDIDALLISALYGELTPAEQTQLAAHLESHPTDKMALAALTSTREAVRESRILAFQAEPPQSVSAMLMQEAARRAPKPEQREGWFARLAKSFMMHPAMAAAAMLVVVLGVATFVNNKKGDQFVESSAPSEPAAVTQSTGSGSAAALDQSIAATAPAADRGGEVAGKDSYRVDLADGDNLKQNGAVATAESESKLASEKKRELEQRRDQAAKMERQASVDGKADTVVADVPAAKGGKAAPAKKAPSGTYLEVRGSDSPQPKDFEGASGSGYDYRDDLAKEQSADPNKNTGYARPPVATVAKQPPRAEPTTKAAEAPSPRTTTTTPTAPPRGNASPGAGAPANNSPVVGGASGRNQNNVTTGTGATTGAKGPAPAAPSPPPPPAQAPAKVAQNNRTPADKPKTIAPAEDKSANDPQLAWAREQHMAIVARVRAGDCQGAADKAVVLANRDFAYYRTNVATDRSVKECLAYIDRARERDADQRAERTKASQKRAAEPAPAKPADAKKATSVDAAQFIK